MSLFKAMSYKYGIPGPGWLHCTRELKDRPIHSYITSEMKRKKHKGYITAIGLRADEMDRVDPEYKSKNFWYPLMDFNIRKKDVLDFWAKQKFDLEIPEHLGNCTWCWKKSAPKLKKVASESPELFRPAMELEPLRNHGSGDEPRSLFRGHLMPSDILKDVGQLDGVDPENYEGSCAEHCEPFCSTN